MFIINYIGIGLLVLGGAVGLGLLSHCLYLYNSVLSIQFTWMLLAAGIAFGLLLRIVAFPDRAATTLERAGQLLVVLGALAMIAIALGVCSFRDIRGVSSLWGLAVGGLLLGTAFTRAGSWIRDRRREVPVTDASLPRS